MKAHPQSLGSVLITGGSGYLGEHLYLRLKELGVSVRNLDLIAPSALQDPNDWIKADITQCLPEAGRSFDTVFHVAAAVPLARDKDKFVRVNAEGTKRVIEWSYKNGARKFVYVSSSAVFGRAGGVKGPIQSDTRPTPCEDYGRSKLLGEKYVLDFVKEHPDMKASIVRPRTIVGPGRLGIFEILFDWIQRDSKIFILGSGRNRLQFLHSDDLVAACILCAESQFQGILNIGARDFLPLRDELLQLCAYAGSKSRILALPLALTRPALEVADFFHLMPFGKWHYLTIGIDFYFDPRATEMLGGWQSRFSNQEALRSAYDWYVRNRENLLGNDGTKSIHKSKPDQRWLSYLKKL